MGHFSYSCKLTGLPITCGTPVVFIPLIPVSKTYLDYDFKSKYGTANICSNEGPRTYFNPFCFPIKGTYDDYGGIEEIIEDDNTKILESFFNLSIQQIVDVICCNRKDDGFSGDLDCIKKPNPENKDTYGNPEYKKEYETLLSLSAIWIHGDVYDNLPLNNEDGDYGKIGLGKPEVLKHLGFNFSHEDKTQERYKFIYTKDGLSVATDNDSINLLNSKYGVYTFKDFKKYCKVKNVTIDIEEINFKTKIRQYLDYIVPSIEKLYTKNRDDMFFRESWDSRILRNYLFDFSEYSSVEKPLVTLYFNAVKAGKLKETIDRFWSFHNYMHCMGKFYYPIGTSPQDGEYESVEKVLDTALSVIRKKIISRQEE